VPLLERGAKGVTPTPAGEALRHHARILMQVMDRMDGEMSEYCNGIRGRVRVQASFSSLSSYLPGDIKDFVRSHENIKLDLQEDITPAIFRAVKDGTCDVGIAPDIADREGLQIYPYRSLSLAVAVPIGHQLSKYEQIRYVETLDFDQVELNPSSGMAHLLDNVARDHKPAKHTYIRVGSYETICRMVANNMGIGVVPLFFAQSHARAFSLKFLPLSDPWAHPMICIAVRESDTLPSAAMIFVDHLKLRGMQDRPDACIPV
jgi:DNA-binding transcriptional LysR family regulator